ncbi:hypothetical protein KKB11_00405 [Candidatus Micrarchaeota archaeon]|nr:hypothetical protein [Candidatus Micrarchaeota archaeon]
MNKNILFGVVLVFCLANVSANTVASSTNPIDSTASSSIYPIDSTDNYNTGYSGSFTVSSYNAYINYTFLTEPRYPFEGNDITVLFEINNLVFGRDLKKTSEAIINGKTIKAGIESKEWGQYCVTTAEYISPHLEEVIFNLGSLAKGNYTFSILHKKITKDCDENETTTIKERIYAYNFNVNKDSEGYISEICKINEDGTKDCYKPKETPVNSESTSSTEKTEEIPQYTEPFQDSEPEKIAGIVIETTGGKPKHHPSINLLTANAIDIALATNPNQIFHLIIVVSVGKNENKVFVDKQKISDVTKAVVSDFKGTIRKIEEENRMVFVDLPANKIDSLAESKLFVEEIKFDSAFKLPAFELTPAKEQFNKKISFVAELLIDDKLALIEISRNSDNDIIEINSNGVKAKTRHLIEIQGLELKLENKTVKILPDKAIQEIKNKVNSFTLKEIELKLIQGIPVYEIKGIQDALFFGLISIKKEIKITVNAQTKTIEKIESPWWSSLLGGISK